MGGWEDGRGGRKPIGPRVPAPGAPNSAAIIRIGPMSSQEPLPSTAPSIDSMLRLILTSRVYDVCRETPLDPAPRLSSRLGYEVLFKREDLQPVFSFKLRGAYNRIAHLTRHRARARHHRGERREPRAGRRLLGAPARDCAPRS